MADSRGDEMPGTKVKLLSARLRHELYTMMLMIPFMQFDLASPSASGWSGATPAQEVMADRGGKILEEKWAWSAPAKK